MTTRFTDHFTLHATHAELPAVTLVPEGTLAVCMEHRVIHKNDGAAWGDWAALGDPGAEAAANSYTDAEITEALSTAATYTDTQISEIVHPYILLEAGQTAADVPAGTPIGALVAQKA